MLRKILITGASSGIGLATTMKCLQQGHSVVALGRNIECLPAHERLHTCQIDFSEIEKLSGNLQQVSTLHSDIDTLICCAGKGRFGGLEEFSFKQIRDLMDINFTSQACVVRHFLPGLKKMGRGNVIFIGSEAALSGGRKGAVYCASKFALRGFAQALRDECARSEIAVSILQPGMVKTPFYDELGFEPGPDPTNYIKPDDIAESIDLILSMRPGTVVDELVLTPQKKVITFKGV